MAGSLQQHSAREDSIATYSIVFILLLLLLTATFLAYQVDLGPLNLLLAILFAVIKAALVLMVFMHVRLSPKLVWVFSLCSFFWLALMLAGFKLDYAGRPLDAPDSHRTLATYVWPIPR